MTSSGFATFCSVPQSGPSGQACRYSNWQIPNLRQWATFISNAAYFGILRTAEGGKSSVTQVRQGADGYEFAGLFLTLWRKRKLASPPLPTFSIIPTACPCTKGKALQRKQNLPPREKSGNVRSLSVIQSSQLPNLLEALR